MHIIKGYHADLISKGTAVALGMFDGVHLGHKKILEKTIAYAKKNKLKSAAIVLTSHPRLLIQGKAPPLLTDLDSKLTIFEKMGLDYVLLLDFDLELRDMDPLDYIQRYLVETLKVKFISIGYDHHFGKDRAGGPKMLEAWASKKNVGLYVCDPVSAHDEVVSSSRIREYVAEGNIGKVNDLLGHEYFIRGVVVKGDGRGKELGYPTANIQVDDSVAIPKAGVYSVALKILDQDKTFKALVNIGKRPTFKVDDEINLEAHILNFSDDIYGEKLELSFKKRIRDEKKFDSKEALIEQIKKDIENA